MNSLIEGDGLALRILPGQAESVLWIHGYTLDSSIWAELWRKLTEYTHIGVDLPGHGASRPIHDGESLGDLALTLAQLAKRYDVRHVVGLSFGGMVALQVALAASFSSLVLGSPALGGGPQDPHAQTRNLELMRSYELRGVGSQLRHLWMQAPPNIFSGASKHPKLWNQLCRVIDKHSWRELGDGRMGHLTNFRQTHTEIERIRAATLILVGEEDMSAFKRCAELIHRAVAGSQRVYVPNSGHLSLLESPDWVCPLLVDHWKEHSAVQQPSGHTG